MRTTIHSKRLLGAVALLAMISMSLGGCTIIRYVDNNENNENNAPAPPPKVVDMLVLVELDRSATSMADSYQQILGALTVALAAKQVSVRKIGLAPMYRRTGNAVPLIYGLGDPSSEFQDAGEAIFFFANDDGQKYLRDRADADGENLASIGLELDTRSVYHPTTSDPNAAPYFTTPADGLIVVQMTAKARVCAYSDAACQLDGVAPAQYLTRRDAQDTSAWLQMGGLKSLKPDKIFHLLIATGELMDIDAFVDKCEAQPDFPAGKLDYMEPSAKAYYEPLATQLTAKGGKAAFVDLCTAMSPTASVAALGSVAVGVRDMF